MTQLLLEQLPNYPECYQFKTYELSHMYWQKHTVSLTVRAGDRKTQASVYDLATDLLRKSKYI